MGNAPQKYVHMTRVLDAVLDRWIRSPQLSLMQLLGSVAGSDACNDDALVKALQEPGRQDQPHDLPRAA